MKGKSLAAACIIVPLAVLTLFVYLYAGHVQRSLPRLGFLHVVDGHLVVQYGQHLLWFDQAAQERRAFNLETLPVNPIGDYAFFSNDEILVYHDQPSSSLNMLGTGTESTHSDKAAGFYRCNLQQNSCKRFASQLPAIQHGFRTTIDTASDTVYIADTRAFRLFKVNAQGDVQARAEEGFKYPNQLLLRNGSLWVADTNNHRLAAIDTATDNFGAVVTSVPIDIGGEFRWPHQFAAAPGGWWVNVGDNRLENGRVVYVASRGGETETQNISESDTQFEVEVAGLVDPLAIVYWGENIWVADYSQPLLQRFSTTGEALRKPDSATLTQLVDDTQATRSLYQTVAYLGMAGFVLTIVAGLLAAWMLERKETADAFNAIKSGGLDRLTERPAKAIEQSNIFWLDNKIQNMQKWLVAGFATATLCTLGAWLAWFASGEDANPVVLQVGGGMTVFIFAMMLCFLWIVNAVAKNKIGIIGESIVLETHNGKTTIARPEHIAYSIGHVMADDVVVALGGIQSRFFNRQQLNDYVFPRLKNAHRLGNITMCRHLWRLREPQFMASIALILLALIGLALVKFALPQP